MRSPAIALLAVALLCAGCDNILGLGETKFTGGVDSGAPDSPQPDACATCGTFASCTALKAMVPSAPSGLYNIDAGTGVFMTYCDQTGDGGGWTLALKVNGRNQTFTYDALIWEDATLLAPNMPGLDRVEAKLETWNAVAFTELRVALEYPVDSGEIRNLVVPLAGAKLRDLFVGGQTRASTLGRDAWKGLVGPSASLQLNCGLEGTNVFHDHTRVRIGILGNEQADCLTPDSRIGVGGGGTVCGIIPTQSAGNSSCFGGDNGDVELAAFAWVFVR